MSPWRAAIDQALLLQKQPGLAVAFRSTALPDGMAVLIRLASDEGGRRKELAQLLDLDESILQSAAAEYLLSICLFPGSDDLRTLGLNPSADLGTAKDHHRLLLKWLHPDRNPDNQVFAERVNQAWSALKKRAKSNPVAVSAADTRDVPDAPSSGRFPLFLWGLAGLAALLLALSSMPDSDIYVADAGPDEQVDTVSQPAASSDSAFEKRLSDLKLSFGEIKSAVLPAAKPVKPRTKPDVEKVQAVREETVKPVKQKPVVERSTIAVEQVLVDEQPAKPIKSPSPALQTKSEARPANAESFAKVEVPVPRAEPARDLQAGGQALLAEFSQRYKLGDINAFMQVFSSSARNNRGDRQAIEDDYARFFSNSNSRKISFSNEKWLLREGVIQFRAKYAASVRRKGGLLPETSKGTIELVMSEENGKLRIQQILLGN